MLKVSLKNQPPENILPWLTYVELLTKKLYNQAGNTSMSVLNQCLTTATWWDRYVLKLDFEAVFHRDIVIQSFHWPPKRVSVPFFYEGCLLLHFLMA